MKINHKTWRIWVFIISVCLIGTLPKSVIAQSMSNTLEQSIFINVQNVNVEKELESLASATRVPISFEALPNAAIENYKITMCSNERTLRQALDEIVTQLPNYKWSYEEGIIKVRPKDKSIELLNLRINEINFPNEPLPNLKKVILELPEIASEIKRLNLEVYEEKSDPHTLKTESIIRIENKNDNENKLPVCFQSLTLREILNEMLKKGIARFWAFKISGEETKVISLTLSD
jgi:hypothetical protein